MADSLGQPDGQSASLAASDLEERLSRRATEPLGVIDVRYAERKYRRLVEWLAGRTSLLDRVRTLYGVEEALTGGRPLDLQHPLGRQADVFSTTIQSFSPAPEAQAARPDAQEHNIAWDARPSSVAEIIAERSTKPAGEQEPPRGGSFRVSRRPPATLAGSLAELSVHPPRATAKVQAPAPERAGSSQPSHPDSDPPDTGAVPAPQRPRDVNMTEAEITNQGPSDFVFKRNFVESSVAEKAGAIKSTSAQEKPATATLSHSRGGALSSVERQSDREISNVQSSKSQPAPLPLTKPLTGDSFSMEIPEMVWRKQRVGPQTPDFTAAGTERSEPAKSVQPTQSAFAYRAEQSGRAGAQAKAQTGSDEVRVEHISPQVIRTIAERVLRTITLDLKLERERRGVPKWR